jgi:hypothetical protein
MKGKESLDFSAAAENPEHLQHLPQVLRERSSIIN